MVESTPLDDGPFFHGTRAELGAGDQLTAGYPSNYKPAVTMNHVYFTALRDGAGLAAEIAAMLGPVGARPHVYLVEPTGQFENDPNVTDKVPREPHPFVPNGRSHGCDRRGHRLATSDARSTRCLACPADHPAREQRGDHQLISACAAH